MYLTGVRSQFIEYAFCSEFHIVNVHTWWWCGTVFLSLTITIVICNNEFRRIHNSITIHIVTKHALFHISLT